MTETKKRRENAQTEARGKKRRNPTKSITIIGRRWFERTNGNTYFSADIFVNGEQVHRIDFEYGYGSFYKQASTEWLYKNGYLPGLEQRENGSSESLWMYRDRKKITLVDSVTDVQRKKDL